MKFISHITDPLFDILFPPCCNCCAKRIQQQGLCCSCQSSLHQTLGVSEEQCIVCQELTLEDCVLCPACMLYPESYRRFRSIWEYQDTAAKLIKQIKYHGSPSLLSLFSSQINETLHDQQLWQIPTRHWPPWDLAVGLPSPRLRDIRRGFRHTTFIARIAAKQIKIDYSIDALTRSGLQYPQASLSIKERRINVAQSFTADTKQINNRQILLLDDVSTSGSSVAEAARALCQAGAQCVDVLTLSRSNKLLKNRLATRNATNLSKL